MPLNIKIPNVLKVKIKTKINVPAELEKTTAVEKDVLLGKTFYSQTKGLRTGTLIAYDVQEEDLGDEKSRLVITRLTSEETPEKDAEIIKQNIVQMYTADLVEITKNGGTLATDEEYAVAENEFQKLARIILGVVRI